MNTFGWCNRKTDPRCHLACRSSSAILTPCWGAIPERGLQLRKQWEGGNERDWEVWSGGHLDANHCEGWGERENGIQVLADGVLGRMTELGLRDCGLWKGCGLGLPRSDQSIPLKSYLQKRKEWFRKACWDFQIPCPLRDHIRLWTVHWSLYCMKSL